MPRASKARHNRQTDPSPIEFFSRLKWLDGRPLLDTIEPYRRELFMRALYEFRDDGVPLYNLVLAGRGKKNAKTLDLVLAGLYSLLIRTSVYGNDGFVLANDEGQAGDDLSLAKKLVAANADEIGTEVDCLSKEIRRKDGKGALQVLPARDVAGAHGKTALFTSFDEIHSYRDWSILEALQPDAFRPDALTWITTYDTLLPAGPLVDLKKAGIKGDDPRMLFSWYSGGELCTDPAFAELPPEQRANPSMQSWPEGIKYIDQQRRRLPSHKFRRLHLNLPGAPDGAFLDPDKVLAAVVTGRHSLPPQDDREYFAYVDMSGGSADDAVLSIGHKEFDRIAVIDLVMKQPGKPPFNPRSAVTRFAAAIASYGLRSVTGDAYAGLTFRQDFEAEGITYVVTRKSKTDLYEAFEPRLNAREIELLDVPRLAEQLMTLVIKGSRIDHQPGDHDDHANAVAGCVDLILVEEYVQLCGGPPKIFDTRLGIQIAGPRTGDFGRPPSPQELAERSRKELINQLAVWRLDQTPTADLRGLYEAASAEVRAMTDTEVTAMLKDQPWSILHRGTVNAAA